MTTSLTLVWSDFKSYLNSNLIPFKMLNQTGAYYLYLSDGALTALCVILKDGGSDQTDFEANYKTQANKPYNYYSTTVNIRQTAATSANATVWAMRNDAASTKVIVIESINLIMSFDSGTPIGRTLQRYYACGFSSATPTGGASQTVAPLASTNTSTQVTDVRQVDTGLTTTGVSFGNAVFGISCPATDATAIVLSRKGPEIRLAAGEGFCIRLAVAAVIGQGIVGEVSWSER